MTLWSVYELSFIFHRWTKAHKLLVDQRIKKDMLAVVVRESEVMLRSEDQLTSKFTANLTVRM